MTYKIKSWSKFQHFKDRRPPWIKLYRDLLESPDWHDLDGESAKALIGLWLIASEDEHQEGSLPDVRHLAFRLRIKETQVNQLLNKLNSFLYQDDIKMISSCYQDDAPETETEERQNTEAEYREETKTEGRDILEKKSKNLSEKQILTMSGITGQLADDFIQHRKSKKATISKTVMDGFVREAMKAGISLDEAIQTSIERGWTGFKAEWVKKDTKEELDWDTWDFGEQQTGYQLLRGSK